MSRKSPPSSSGNGETGWTLDALEGRVREALAVDYPGPDSGRIRAVPDRRTIRYYGTLGLLDRPAAMRGRTALYGRRHLLQLVAIKRLQAEGLSLAEVQARLTGRSTNELEAIARLPEGPTPPPSLFCGPAPGPPPPAPARAFWRTAAAPPSPASSADADADEAAPAATAGEARPTRPDAPGLTSGKAGTPPVTRPMTALALAPGATLLLDASRPLTDEDVADVAEAAAALLRRLHQRGLLRPPPEKGDLP